MKNKIIFILQCIALVILFAATLYIFELSTAYGQQTSEQIRDPLVMINTDVKIEESITKQKQDKILACLLFLESTNRHNVIVLDTNNKYSIGGYQFQVDTVQDILARYEKKQVTEAEAIKIAKSPSESKELARRSIFDYGLASKWTNSFIKMRSGACPEITYQDLSILK